MMRLKKFSAHLREIIYYKMKAITNVVIKNGII